MFNKYSILKLYIKSIEADIKYIVISGMEEFGRILCKELKNENIKIDYVFDDYNNIDKQCFKEINFISLENLRKIADNAIILISDRDPEIFQNPYQ